MRSSVSRAYWSHADEESEDVCWEDEHDVDDDENDVSDDAAYWCHSCGPDREFGDVVDRVEQDIVCALVAADRSLSDEDVCEDISECVHAECVAFFGREQARQHGVHVERVVHSFRPKSELEIKKRWEHVEHAKRNSTCRWAGDQVCPKFVGNRSVPGSSTRPWSANWSRDVSKTDKKHTKGKDQPNGAGKRTSFRTRAPFNREARTAQAMNDEAGMCTGKCFKFVPFVPSSDPVPGHVARGVIDPGLGRLQGLHDPVPGRQVVQNFNDPVPGRQFKKDDLVPGHLGRGSLIIDDEDDEDGNRSWEDVAELAQQRSDQKWSSVWKADMQVRVVDDGLEPEIRCAVEEPARRAPLGRHPEQLHVFQFGKYRNERCEDVTEETPDYYFWCSQERKRSKYLQHYLDWVTEHYDVDPVRSTLTSKATGRILEAKPSPTKGQKQTESQLKKSLRQEGWKQAAKCVPWCDPRHATRAGSNATHVRLMCLQCGTVTQGKREEPLVKSPETCPHMNTDARGSSSTTHRVYCKDCGQLRQ